MGTDKATIVVGGETLARRTARLLSAVCDPAVEVGPGASDLPAVREEPEGSGPLAALLAGWRYVGAPDSGRPVVVVACDLPRLTETALRRIAEYPGSGSVVPVLAARPQWACTRWSPTAIAGAIDAFATGERGLRVLATASDLVRLAVDDDPEAYRDADRPEDLRDIAGSEPGSVPPGGAADDP